jgi:hypothetical protein
MTPEQMSRALRAIGVRESGILTMDDRQTLYLAQAMLMDLSRKLTEATQKLANLEKSQ